MSDSHRHRSIRRFALWLLPLAFSLSRASAQDTPDPPYSQPPSQQPAPNGQHAAETPSSRRAGHGNPSYGQPSTFQQPTPYGQPSAYQQPTPFGQPSTYQQPTPYGQPSTYQQPSSPRPASGRPSTYARPTPPPAQQAGYGQTEYPPASPVQAAERPANGPNGAVLQDRWQPPPANPNAILPATEPGAPARPQPPSPLVIAASPVDIERAAQVTKAYELSDLVRAFSEQYEVSSKDAQLLLAYELRRPERNAPSQLRWNQHRLVVRASAEQHARYERRLEQLRKTAFHELNVAICLATVPSEALAQLAHPHLKWNVDALPVEVRAMEPAAVDTAHASSLRKQPVKWAVIDHQTTAQLEQKLADIPNFRVLGRPKIRLHNGRRAAAESSNHRAFVVGFNDHGAPEVRNFPVGWQVVVIPELRDRHVVVRGHWNNTEVLGVETVDLPNDRSLQIPEILQRQLNWTHQIPLGSTLVLAGNRRRNAEGKYEESLALLRVTGEETAVPAETASLIPSVQLHAAAAEPVSHQRPDPSITKAYDVRELLPVNKESQAFALRDLVERVRAMEARRSPGAALSPAIAIHGHADTQSLVIRHTSQGHHRIAQILDEIHRSLHTTLKASLLELPASIQFGEHERQLGQKLQSAHAVLTSGDLLRLESADASRSPIASEDSPGGCLWKLENGDEIAASFVTSVELRRLGKHVITVQHRRGEHIVSEFKREVRDYGHLLVDITPPPTLLETTQKLLGWSHSAKRQFLVITPTKHSSKAAHAATATDSTTDSAGAAGAAQQASDSAGEGAGEADFASPGPAFWKSWQRLSNPRAPTRPLDSPSGDE